jgi:cobalt-zinc-cadmium efflux system outer membrane protein
MPPSQGSWDSQATAVLGPLQVRPTVPPVEPTPPGGEKKSPFELPQAIPGSDKPPIRAPKFEPTTPAAERDKAVQAAYPALTPVAATSLDEGTGPALSLADLQQLAVENSPVVRQAAADADTAYGQVIQAGLWPNPTIGYEADQWQPGPQLKNTSGQQGAFINQLIKTAGKLSLARQVAGYDYINALVAVRRAQFDVSNQVRTNYFAALVARQSWVVNKALADMADEVYRLQLKQIAAGEAAGYEPLQLYAQAVQARNAVIQAAAAYRAAWKQLIAAVGRPDLPPTPLAGRADTAAPTLALEDLTARMLEQHTDLLTARNALVKAQTNLTLQRRIPIPDVTFNNTQQHDNATGNYQFNLQLGIPIPLFDRNQGNIRSAYAQIASATEKLTASQYDLTGRLAEAFTRYDSNKAIADNYRDRVLPSLNQAYASIIRRYQVEPDKVGFNDIVVAQQNLATALQAYLAALGAQWQAVVDVGNLSQQDDLYPSEPKKK